DTPSGATTSLRVNVIGAGKPGYENARLLSDQDHDIVVIDNDPKAKARRGRNATAAASPLRTGGAPGRCAGAGARVLRRRRAGQHRARLWRRRSDKDICRDQSIGQTVPVPAHAGGSA